MRKVQRDTLSMMEAAGQVAAELVRPPPEHILKSSEGRLTQRWPPGCKVQVFILKRQIMDGFPQCGAEPCERQVVLVAEGDSRMALPFK